MANESDVPDPPPPDHAAHQEVPDRLRARLAELAERIPGLDPHQTRALIEQGGRLLDIRDTHELAEGAPPQARHIPRGFLEMRIGEIVPDQNTPIVLLCAGGQRSLLAAESLSALGYRDVRNLAGGMTAWKQAGLPLAPGGPLLDDRARTRYARHLAMPEIGEAGQSRLLAARVLIVGAGGLGSPTAFYLAAAGVGELGLVDGDRVERSNLQRQILHTDAAVGHLKTESAAERIHALNPDIRLHTHPVRLTRDNVEEVLSGYQVVVDGSDNFPTRYLLNDACIRLGLPLVYGAVFRFSGQVGVFQAGDGIQPCYRCLFPRPPAAADAPSCAEAGVMGVMPGIVGCFQSTEVIKLILGLGEPLSGRILHIDALTGSTRTSRLLRDPACRWCRASAETGSYPDYEAFCRDS